MVDIGHSLSNGAEAWQVGRVCHFTTLSFMLALVKRYLARAPGNEDTSCPGERG